MASAERGLERRRFPFALGSDAVEPLIVLLKSSRSPNRQFTQTCEALGNLGEYAAPAIPVLLERVSLDVDTDKPILETLEQIDPQTEKIRRHVAEQMNDADPVVSERAFKLHDYVRMHFGDPIP